MLRHLLLLLALTVGCATAPVSERHYYAGRFGEAIAASTGARTAKYLTMKAFVSGGQYDEAIATAVRAQTSTDPAEQAEALLWEGFARYAQVMTSGGDDYGEAADRIERAFALRRSIGERRGIAEAAFYRGLVAERQGDEESALKLYREALALAKAGGFALEESYAQRHIGFIERSRGDLSSARQRLERSRDLRERIGFRVFLPFSVLSLAETDVLLGRFEDAEREFARARALAATLGFRRLEVLVDLNWSELREKQNRGAEAADMLRRALKTSEEIAYPRGVQLARTRLDAIDRR